MSDAQRKIGELREQVAAFARERDWEQFHSLKNLSMALAGEAAELMEPFQWLKDGEDFRLMEDEAKRVAVEEELADVVIYALQFANRAGIDVGEAVDRKMVRNERRYPADASRGSAAKRGPAE